VFFKSTDVSLKSSMLDRLAKDGFETVIEVSPEFKLFTEKKGSIEMFPVISVKRQCIIGYVGTHVVPDVYKVRLMSATGLDRKTGESIIYPSCFDMRIIDIDF